MKLKINGRTYSALSALRGETDPELYDFLEKWFDGRDFIVGHTSGSTGKPKEIRLAKADMRVSARLTNSFFRLGSGSVFLLCLSVGYIAGKMMVVRALEAGGELQVLNISSSPLRDWSGVADLAAMVPLQVEETLNREETAEKLKGIRQLLIGGAPVSRLLEKRLGEFPSECFVTYGMTETVSHVALRRLNGGPVYTALGKVSFSTDLRGCLVIHAPHLSGGRYVTNDLVKLQDSRHFEWIGRYDHIINSGGIKLSPEAIEVRLADRIPQRFFISSRPDERLGERVVLLIEGEEWEEGALSELRRVLRMVLSPYEVPREIIFCPRFQETSSGKLIRDIRELIPEFSSGDGKKRTP